MMMEKNRFGEFISNLRKEKQISLEQLCDGLCDFTMLSRFERGEREPEKLMQNRFLTRLGTVPENYENFLYYKDYRRWEKRQGILHNILEENIAEAKHLLEEYFQEYNMEYSLELQFYLAMLAQIRRYEGCDKEELAELFTKALELTVPDLEQKGFMDRVLSLEEINLLLEKVYFSEEALERYEEILIYIEKMERTMLAMAKVYPKAVYYYYEAWKKTGNTTSSMALRMLELCDKAIEILRDANRMFYLWELFCMREQLIPLLPDSASDEAEQNRRKECKDWKETLEEIYQEYDVTIAMYEFCYLYVESENYCIGDVIRIRRKMLGLSQKKLCENLCDERTLSRLENNKSKAQKEVVQCLFERLNLSTELKRTELVTDSQEAIEKYRELNRQNNNWNFVKVSDLVKEIKEMIDYTIPSNKQAIERNLILNLYKQGVISNNEYIEKMKKILEYTIPYKSVIGIEKKYFTNEEIVCIQNITLNKGCVYQELEETIKVLIEICEKTKFPYSSVRLYECIMAAVSSYLGDNEEYDYSNSIKKSIIKRSLISRRIGAISGALYGIFWNQKQRLNRSVSLDIMIEELQYCINLGLLCKDYYRVAAYQNRLKEISKKYS